MTEIFWGPRVLYAKKPQCLLGCVKLPLIVIDQARSYPLPSAIHLIICIWSSFPCESAKVRKSLIQSPKLQIWIHLLIIIGQFLTNCNQHWVLCDKKCIAKPDWNPTAITFWFCENVNKTENEIVTKARSIVIPSKCNMCPQNRRRWGLAWEWQVNWPVITFNLTSLLLRRAVGLVLKIILLLRNDFRRVRDRRCPLWTHSILYTGLIYLLPFFIPGKCLLQLGEIKQIQKQTKHYIPNNIIKSSVVWNVPILNGYK